MQKHTKETYYPSSQWDYNLELNITIGEALSSIKAYGDNEGKPTLNNEE